MNAGGYRMERDKILYRTGFLFAMLALLSASAIAHRLSLDPEKLEIGKANVSGTTYRGKKRRGSGVR